ncbi:MAG: ATPase [Alphaproteobacteria bacterium]|nr:ATPase [Alphaproteobacteria bacterium]
MNVVIRPAPLKRHIVVNVGQARAFEVFTARMERWWPASHSIGATRQVDVVIEPRVGGRWYERGEDGQECLWGEVLAWEPPDRVVLAWRLNAHWTFDPTLTTEVEVRFLAQGEQATRVQLEHRHLERFGEGADAVRGALDGEGGWPGMLRLFAGFAQKP